MAHVEHIPQHLLAKSGEQITPKFLAWVSATKDKLLKAFPPSERAFCRTIDKMKSRLPQHRTRLHYTRQKWFIVADSVVFFGDFYFGNIKLLVEIDGREHTGPAAREKDEWRSKLISAWGVAVVRTTNEQTTETDFRDMEMWFISHAVAACSRGIGQQLLRDYDAMRRAHSHIYANPDLLTTYRKEG